MKISNFSTYQSLKCFLMCRRSGRGANFSKISKIINTMFLSFLERERDRTVTVFDYSFQSVAAFRLDVPDRSSFLTVLTVPDRFRSFYERFRSFVTYLRRSTGYRIININGNALERIVENGHGTVTLTHQKRKKHCKKNINGQILS